MLVFDVILLLFQFLVRVSDFQQKAVQEEQAKVDADHGKQKKQSVSRKPVI